MIHLTSTNHSCYVYYITSSAIMRILFIHISHLHMMRKKKCYVVIMAGGSGTRLWPLSRKENPKQFHKLTSQSRTMLQETCQRVARVVPHEHIYVSTTIHYVDLVLEQLPHITKDQIIVEPCARNTAPAIALAAQYVKMRDPHAIVATVASDHAIKNNDEFIDVMQTGFSAVMDHPTKFATIGINPTFPSTELGYIKMGPEIKSSYDKRVFSVESFKEKPDEKTARKYLSGWEYLWNASYFIFDTHEFLKHVSTLTPHIAKAIAKIEKEWSKSSGSMKEIEKIYKKLPDEPIDTVIVEQLTQQQRIVVPSELEWSDVGNWGSLYDFFKNQHEAHFVSKGNHVDADSRDCLVYSSDKMIATLGLKDIVIVENHDTILVADRKKVKEVKKLVTKLKSEGKHLYL